MTKFPALNARVFPDAPGPTEIDVSSETGGPSSDMIELRLLDNGKPLQWTQFGAAKKIILFRCFIPSG
jgi:hypothetical protein